MIALGGRGRGEYKIRPYQETGRSSLDEAKRNPGREMGVSPDFIRATTVEKPAIHPSTGSGRTGEVLKTSRNFPFMLSLSKHEHDFSTLLGL